MEAENLKNQEEAERIDREATEDALRQMAELDAQLQVYIKLFSNFFIHNSRPVLKISWRLLL